MAIADLADPQSVQLFREGWQVKGDARQRRAGRFDQRHVDQAHEAKHDHASTAGMVVLGFMCLVYMALVEPARPTLARVTLHLPTLPKELDGLRVGQISDCHLGMPYSAHNLKWAVEQMRRERPEVVALTGDFVSRRAAIPSISSLLRGLSAPLGVYAVPGNHDYLEGIAAIHAELTRLDIPLLINEH